jgi:hypothetical protein
MSRRNLIGFRLKVQVLLSLLLGLGYVGSSTVGIAVSWAVAPTACVPESIGLDPAIWNTARGTFLGHALGQTFLATDTLITRLTVWRPPGDRSVLGVHLFITAVDTTRTPPRPIASQILLDGPTLHVYDSDPPGQLVELSFVIDPPLALPRPGLYAFFLQTEACNGGEFLIIANDQNPYPHGIYWITGRVTVLPCFLRSVAGGEDNADLLFNIEFCRPDQTTPVRPSTWGQVKVRYR